MKVYLVSTGCYSDYTPRAIYSTNELALEANRYFGNENDIEEFDLDVMPEHPAGMYPYKVLMRINGDAYEVSATSSSIGLERYWNVGNKTEIRPDWVFGEEYRYVADHGSHIHEKFLTYLVWAKDEQHAVKIANERRVMAIANGFTL